MFGAETTKLLPNKPESNRTDLASVKCLRLYFQIHLQALSPDTEEILWKKKNKPNNKPIKLYIYIFIYIERKNATNRKEVRTCLKYAWSKIMKVEPSKG